MAGPPRTAPREREQDVLGPDQSDKLGAEARPMRRARRVNKLAHEPFAGGLIAETARPRRGGAETVRWSIDVETALDTSPGTPRRPADVERRCFWAWWCRCAWS